MTKAPKSQKWPVEKVEKWAVGRLKPYANNAKTHPPEQIAILVNLIRDVGWTNPILVDEKGEIIAGHGRLMAALEIGLSHVPVIVAKGWTEAQKRAYRLADNASAEGSQWIPELVKVELAELERLDFDIGRFGLDNIDLPPLEGAGEPARARSKTKTTIFVSVGTEHSTKARSVIVAALNKAKIAHNL